MATAKGLDGVVKIGTADVAELKSWSIDHSARTVDSSVMGTDYSTHQSTIKDWNGSAEAFWDPSDTTGQVALVVGATVALSLYPEGDASGDTYFSGNAIVEQIGTSASFEGLVEATFSFKGTGPLLTSETVA